MNLYKEIRYSILLLIAISALSCTSDDRDDNIDEIPISGDYNQGMFILNEGGFGSSNASVSLGATATVIRS